ncbi:MAG: DUF2110 family protein [Halobacteriales archaeon]
MVVLATKVYGPDREAALDSLASLVENDVGELGVDYGIGVRHDDFPSVTITGEDATVARNLLIERWGEIVPRLAAGEIFRGTLESWDDAGWHLDAGESVVVGADRLGLGPGRPSQVATRFGLVPHVPLSFEHGDEPRLAAGERDRLHDWRTGPGRVNANAVTRSQFRATINRAGHADDVVGIERLGLLEHSAVCAEGTDPPGLLASIGAYMPGDLACVL